MTGFSIDKNKIKRLLPVFIMGLSVLGLVDAAFLTFKHYTGGDIKCFVVSGCDIVTSSQYSVLFDLIPLALMGVLFYFTALLLGFVVSETNSKKLKFILWTWSGLGVLSSLWFLYIQAFILEAYCFYCLVSIVNTILIFGIVSTILFLDKKLKN
jgi:uncharacterized membrane protein